MASDFEVNWDSFVRDAVVTASVADYVVEGKTGASVLSNVRILKRHYHPSNLRLEGVTVQEKGTGRVFEIKTNSLIDFTQE